MLKRNTITAPDMATAKTILTEKFGAENETWNVYCWGDSVHGVYVTYETYIVITESHNNKVKAFVDKLLEAYE